MKKITLFFTFLVVMALFFSGCVNPPPLKRQTGIEDVVFQQNFYKVGSKLDAMIKVINGYDVSFKPKIKVIFNKDCFTSMETTEFEEVKANTTARLSWVFSESGYRNQKCKDTESITFQLFDSATDNILDEKIKTIEVVR